MSGFEDEFRELLVAQQLYDPEVFDTVEVFDEVAIYSRYAQLDFLGHLSVAEQNRKLILAAVRQLDRIVERFAKQVGMPIIRMVSVTDWDSSDLYSQDGATDPITSHLWIGNFASDAMKDFRVHAPRSAAASFVADAVGGGAHEIFESDLKDSWPEDCPRRVYIARLGDIPAARRIGE